MEVDIIISLAIAAVVLTIIVQTSRILRTRSLHKTLRQAIQSGQPVTAELVEQLDTPARPGDFDQRAGYILIALAIAAITAAAISGPTQDSFREITSLAIFPLFVGLALLLRLYVKRRSAGE